MYERQPLMRELRQDNRALLREVQALRTREER